MSSLITGTAICDMELVTGMDMTGFLARSHPSAGIHDNLKIRCIIFDDGSTEVLFVVCDLLGLSSGFVKSAAAAIEESLAIPAANIIIACTHTHSGPASIFLQDCGSVDEMWLERLKAAMVQCAKKASEHKKPSLLSYGTGHCSIHLNRVWLGQREENTLIDRQVGILAIRDALSREMDTVMVNFACHPVVLGADNLLYSKDYPHYMEEYLKEGIGANLKVVFTSGCCGDTNPILRGSFKESEMSGRRLGESVLDVLRSGNGEEVFADTEISVKTFHIDIPLDCIPDEAALLELIAEYNTSLEQESGNGGELPKTKADKAFKHWAERTLAGISSGKPAKSIRADVKLVKIGKLVIVALPFEPFHDIGLKIKEHFGFDHTVVLGYANGDFGYLPSGSQYRKSAYEVSMAYKYYGYPGPVREDAEEIILNAVFGSPGQ